MRWVLVSLVAAALAACAKFSSEGPDDAGADAGDATTAPLRTACDVPDQQIFPVEATAFVGAVDAGGPSQAVTCNVEHALALDGVYAGLDRLPDAGRVSIGNERVAVCIAFRFAEDVLLQNVTVQVAPLADACGASPCVADDPDAGCGTALGLQFNLFSGRTLDTLTNHVDIHTSPLPAAYTYGVEPGSHYVVACRDGLVAVTRDDVGIDALWASCR